MHSITAYLIPYTRLCLHSTHRIILKGLPYLTVHSIRKVSTGKSQISHQVEDDEHIYSHILGTHTRVHVHLYTHTSCNNMAMDQIMG